MDRREGRMGREKTGKGEKEKGRVKERRTKVKS